ncbi:MAG: hypothetical protein ACYCYK_05670 [Candidatus Dormibacteria bacterium]
MAAATLDEDRDPDAGKRPTAVELGSVRGKKGGKARAAKLTPEERREIASWMAQERWGGTRR